MKQLLAVISILFLILSCTRTDVPVYMDFSADIEDRVEDALSRMTLEEKTGLIHAQSKFSSCGVPRLGIPDVWMSDGPFGVREESVWDKWEGAGQTNDSCTAYPALTCLAATWSREVSAMYGKCIGEEARYRNKTVLLAPGVNIMRTPLCGRNFEYFGEDPFLAGELCVPYIQNIQKSHVGACVKHFALNNQESFRSSVNIVVDDRALYEIYLPAFKAAVTKGGVWSVMGAYNKYKDIWCCHNPYLLNGILKKDWEFDGVVISDWGGTHDSDEAVRNGLDMEFGTGTNGLTSYSKDSYDNFHLAMPYLKGIEDGRYTVEELDDKVRRVLRLIFRTTMSKNRPWGSFATQEHYDVARRVAQEGIVLLQNRDSILPLRLDNRPEILIVGSNAKARHAHGGGSSYLKTTHEISPYEGLVTAIGTDAEVSYAQGYKPYGGNDVPEDMEQLRQEAVEAAKKADIVLLFGGLNKWAHQDCEGMDRLGYGLPYQQDALIEAIVEVNPNVVVALTTGTPVAMPWKDKVKAIVYNWYLGSEGGNAIADVFTGKVSPSGKLPFTIAAKLDDYPPHALGAYDRANKGDVEYKESIFVGYRWFDTYDVNPAFAFGHGLGYTTFGFGQVTASRKSLKCRTSEVAPTIAAERNAGKGPAIKFRIPVTNTGHIRGAEVIQLYVRDMESSLARPEKELKAFEKVWLDPGQTKVVELVINEEDLRYFDDTKHMWISEKGEFEILIGTSSRDIFATKKITLN